MIRSQESHGYPDSHQKSLILLYEIGLIVLFTLTIELSLFSSISYVSLAHQADCRTIALQQMLGGLYSHYQQIDNISEWSR